MPIYRKLSPLLSILAGVFALMAPSPSAGLTIAELSPLPPMVLFASANPVADDNAMLADLRNQASEAMHRLQIAARP